MSSLTLDRQYLDRGEEQVEIILGSLVSETLSLLSQSESTQEFHSYEI